MTAPVPSLKPHVQPSVPGTECCGCCSGIKAETPQGIFNRDGLSAISYRIGDYARFRASLHAALSSADFSALASLKTRDGDDFTIGLIDAFSCAADVLTFYQERIASESWLRTAVERVSLQEMGKLVGYRLRPGVAAETPLAFALDLPPTPPATLVPDPGNFVTGVPDTLTLEAGLQVRSVPGPGETPQTFELVETLAEARPAWNAIRPWMSEPHQPVEGDTDIWLSGTALSLRPGDGLLLAGQAFLDGTGGDNWNFRLASAVVADADNDRTRVTFARALDSGLPTAKPAVAVFVMRKRSAVFGSNAPLWRSMDQQYREGYAAVYGGASDQANWQDYNISTVSPDTTSGAVDLDQLQAEIAADVDTDRDRRSFAVLAKGAFNAPQDPLPSDAEVDAYRITATTDLSRAEFALSSKVTRLSLAGPNLSEHFFSEVTQTSVYAKSERLEIADRPVDEAVSDNTIPVEAGPEGLLPGRRLILRGRLAEGATPVAVEATLVAADATAAGRAILHIDPPLSDPLDRASVVVHANVALASHGEAVTQVLGAGDASKSFQRFQLTQLPLTYRAAANEIGAAPELTLRVGDVAWQERPTLYGAGARDHAFTLRTDEQGRLFAAFGDGVRGARLPSGVNNVRATYRKGLGLAGNVAADSLTQLMTRPLGLKGVSNPLAAEGGTDPEPASDARATIPLTTRTLGRTVSVLDYEDYARAYTGIAKARAAVLQLRAGPGVAITLAAPGGEALTEASPVWANLLDALKSHGDPYVPLVLLSHQASTFRLGIRVKAAADRDPDQVLADVEAALRAHFSFEARALGQPVQQSDVIATAQAVPGVVAVNLTRLYGGSAPAEQTAVSLQPRLLASRMRVAGGVALAAEMLTLDPAPFDLLEHKP